MRFVTSSKQPKIAGADAQAASEFVRVYREAISGLLQNMGEFTGTIEEALSGLPKFTETLSKWFNPIKKVVDSGGKSQESVISRNAKVNWRFDMLDPRSVAYAEDRAGALVVEIADEVKAQIRQLVSDALTNGVTPADLGAQISRTVGLHTRWATAVDRFYDRTLTDLLKKMPRETALEKATKMTEAYRARLLKTRGFTIARTELNRARNHGRYVSWLQAVEDGTVDVNTAGKRWLVARPCDVCAPLNGQTVGVLDWFKDGNGEEKYNMPPVHPNCRCTAVLVVDWKSSTAASNKPVEKARERKYATRSEAARAAARARWGDRATTVATSGKQWKDATTNAEVTAQWNELWGGQTQGDFSRMDPEYANHCARELTALFNQFPEIAKTVPLVCSDRSSAHGKFYGRPNGPTLGNALAGVSRKHRYLMIRGDVTMDEVTAIVQKGVETDYSVPVNLGTPQKVAQYLMTHEFGHVVEHFAADGFNADAMLGEAWDAATQPWQRMDLNPSNLVSQDRWTQDNLSRYGTTSVYEMFAESWAEYQLADSPRPYAKTMIETSFGFVGKPVPTPVVPVQKARPRKYATRSEAARAAARARWGTRTYSQGATVVEDKYGGSPQTRAVEPFDSDAFVKAVQAGSPVTLVGVHGSYSTTESFPEAGRTGSGLLDKGTYFSLVDPSGVTAQAQYYARQRRILAEVTLQKPLVIEAKALGGPQTGEWVDGPNGRIYEDRWSKIQKSMIQTAESVATTLQDRDDIDRGYIIDVLKRKGYDGIVYLHEEADPGTVHGSQLSVFDAMTSVKVLDYDLMDDEFRTVTTAGDQGQIQKAVTTMFPGGSFDLVPIEMFGKEPMRKARPRKYASRSEAARAAARARWGNRAADIAYAYSQEAATSTRPEPVSVASRAFEGYGENMGTVLDSILTESVQPFDEAAFLEAAAKGPVSILGIHGKMGMEPDLVFGDEPRGGGMSGPGIYSSLITDMGVISQMGTYERRGRQALLRCDLQKPMIITDADRAADFGKWTGDQFDTMGLMKALMATGMSKNEAYDEIKTRTSEDPYYQAVRGLKEFGFDSIVVIGKNSMVSTFSGSQIKVVDPVLSVEERDIVYAAGNPVLKAADLPFDGRGFVFVPVDALAIGSMAKARPRKYGSRSEAARAAARARWGNRAAEVAYAYRQEIGAAPRETPEITQTTRQTREQDAIVDTVLTSWVDKFEWDAFAEAAATGPVSLVGIHAKFSIEPTFQIDSQPRGEGKMGPGVYASMINETGMLEQSQTYQLRGRQALLRMNMKKALVLGPEDLSRKGVRGMIDQIDYSQFDLVAVGVHMQRQGVQTADILTTVEGLKSEKLRGNPSAAIDFLKSEGYDGIVQSDNMSVSVFSGDQVQVVDPVLTAQERRIVYETSEYGASYVSDFTVPALKSAPRLFDGRGFTYVPLDALTGGVIQKKMSRSEAGRLAARARWGQVRSPMTASNIETLANGKPVSIDAKELPDLMAEMAKKRLPTPLSKVEVKGYRLFQTNLGLSRAQMPQIPTNQKGKFFGFLQAKGIIIRPESVDPKTLKPVQSDVLGSRSGKLLAKMRAGTYTDDVSDAIVVSSDGYIIDGHHRWAAAVAHSMEKPSYEFNINRIDLPVQTLLVEANAFTKREGLEVEPLLKIRRWIRRSFRLAPKP